MDQKLRFVEVIDSGDAYLDFILCLSKVYELHAILQDAATTVMSDGKALGYCYIIWPGPVSRLLGHVITLPIIYLSTF